MYYILDDEYAFRRECFVCEEADVQTKLESYSGYVVTGFGPFTSREAAEQFCSAYNDNQVNPVWFVVECDEPFVTDDPYGFSDYFILRGDVTKFASREAAEQYLAEYCLS